MSEAATTLEPVSVQDAQGRVLSGVGVSAEDLQKAVERYTPAAPETPEDGAAGRAGTTPAAPGDEPAPKPTRGQKRFDQLTGEREEQRRRAEAAEQERDDLRKQIEALRTTPTPAPAAAPTPEPTPSAQPTAKPTLKQFVEQIGTAFPDYETALEAYTDAREAFILQNSDAQIRQRIEADRASRAFADTVQTVWAKGREVFKDFDAVLQQGPGSSLPLGPDGAEGPISSRRGHAILTSPHAAHLVYAIAKDAALATRLSTLDDIGFGVELARLVPASGVASPASTPSVGTVPPPAPYQPVGSGSPTTVPPLADLPKTAGYDFDKSGYRERRARERQQAKGGSRRL